MLPVELAASGQTLSRSGIERACGAATRRQGSARAVALAVNAPNVQRASQLLFGTGVGVVAIVGVLGAEHDPTMAARQVLAAGANEIQLADQLLDPELSAVIRSAVGDDVALTVYVPLLAGSFDLAGIERAVHHGADFVKLQWPTANPTDVADIAGLFELLGCLGRGGVKLAVPDHEVGRVRSLVDATFGPLGGSRHHRIRNYRAAERAWDL